MAYTNLGDMAAIVQRDFSENIARFRPTKAKTLATFEEGTRSKTGRLAGLQINYASNRPNGQSWISPLAGDTSYKKSTKRKFKAMYAGLAHRIMNIWMEKTILADMNRGVIPLSYIEDRRDRIDVHMWKKNWAAIGNGTGSIAVVSSAATTTITTLADASARGTSKGAYRVQLSDSTDDPLLYDVVNASDVVVATFYCTSKTATVLTVTYTLGNAAAVNTSGFFICESGSWKKEMNGIAGLISDSTSRIFQGADVAVDTFLQNPAVDAGAAVITPTSIHSAKGIMMTRSNTDPQSGDEFNYICHLSATNYRDLAKFGYTLRQVQQNEKRAMTTIGLPDRYEDGDTEFVPDADYEECYIDFREKAPYFEYTAKKFGLVDVGGVTRFQYQGSYDAGSSEQFENYDENVQLVFDGKGASGKGKGGNPASAVSIKNILIPANRQNVYGV